MTYILRPYQEEAVESAIDFFLNKKDKKNKIIVEPTGAGKSLIIANIAIRLDEPILVLQPAKELLLQNYKKFVSYGFEASIFSASVNRREIGEVTFATIGSIYKNPELFKDFKYVLIDECHKLSPKEDGMYVQFFESLNIKVAGLTATPFRLKSYNFPEPHSKLNFLSRMRPKFFHDVLHITQISEMVENNWWSPLIYEQVKFDSSKLKINSTGANYTDISVSEAFKSNNLQETIVSSYNKLLSENRKQIIIYVPSINEAESLSKKLGLDCIHSNLKPKERDKVLQDFESGKKKGIINISVLAIGYDNQKIDGIIDSCPTLSLAMYYQRLGRGVRIDMSPNPTKKDCKVIDLAGNYDLFGRIEDLEIKQVAGKWVVMSGKKVLTNTPIIKGEEITELDDEVMWFGKFENEKFKDIPKWYWQYVSKNFTRRSMYEKLFQYIDLKKY